MKSLKTKGKKKKKEEFLIVRNLGLKTFSFIMENQIHFSFNMYERLKEVN